jgi:hypothetical protein
LALFDAFEKFRMLGIRLAERGQLVGELHEQLQALILGEREKVVTNLGERAGEVGHATQGIGLERR